LGVRWGIGHSTGLLLVGIVFILLSLNSDADTIEVPDGVSKFFESMVGIFMIVLGVYGIRRAWEKRPKPYTGVAGDSDGELADCSDICSPGKSIDQNHGLSHNHLFLTGKECGEQIVLEVEDDEEHDASCLGRLAKSVSARTMAIFAGIIHGLAGPGGVLGVIPAVQLHNAKLAAIYLGCFCLSSTLTMGLFAILYGTFSSKLGQGLHREFLIESISASLSIIVGITWLTLLSIGKLEDVFP